MTYFTGVTGRVQYWDGTNLSAIGAVSEFAASWRTRRTTTDGIGFRTRRGGRLGEAIPNIVLRYVPQDLNLIDTYLLKTAQGNLSKFSLRYYDGQQYGEIKNIAPNTVEIGTGHGRQIQINVAAIAENWSVGISAQSWEDPIATPPMTWRETATLAVFGTNLITHFREWSMRFNNNAFADVTGSTISPAEVFWGKADYSGRIEIAKSIGAFGGNVINNSTGAVVIAFKDRISPTTKTFTFNSCNLRQAEVRLPMGLIVHRIEFESNQLVIT